MDEPHDRCKTFPEDNPMSPSPQSPTVLFVSGMFRSGTTLVARMLNAHPQVSFASDPYLPFFKTFRTFQAARKGIHVDTKAPLHDYYFQPQQQEILAALQGASLDAPFTEVDPVRLREEIQTRTQPFSPRIIPLLDRISGATYVEAFGVMMDILRESSGKPEAGVVGFKEVWADEFFPCVARSIPNAKFIQLVRDPRAVAASKNVLPERYPWRFLGKQWRKFAALAWHYRRLDLLQGRLLQLKYEELITHPEPVIARICEFLGVPVAQEMLDPKNYRDGEGQDWVQNTSHGRGRTDFDPSAIHRWRKVLQPEELQMMEFLCGPEMELFGYAREACEFDPERFLLDPVRVPDENLAAWIRLEVPNDPLSHAIDMSAELLRHRLIHARDDRLSRVAVEVIQGCFLFPEVLAAIREQSGKAPRV
jgi:hypothetical protein